MHRFFVQEPITLNSEFILSSENSRQIVRVLRLKLGEEIILLDNSGFEYLARLTNVSEQNCVVMIRNQNLSQTEPKTNLTLILGLTQREKFELILQKCTEIGVSAFLPVVTSRSLLQKPSAVVDKYPRWRKILTEAAEQSHRGRIPDLLPAVTLEEGLQLPSINDPLKMVLWEDESKTSIKQVLRCHQESNVTMLIGPEGGLSQNEVEKAVKHGFVSVSLGKRILRMESAAIAAAAIVLYEKE